MPSIEIICEKQNEPTNFDDLPFAVEAERELISHRLPSLFQEDFDKLKGCIYHLGNPNLKKSSENRFYFAYYLLSEESRHSKAGFLEFLPEFKPTVKRLIKTLLSESPVGRVVFTTDWQFGPEVATRGGELSFEEFWRKYHQHQPKHKLKLNGIYYIFRDS